jgi:predicted phage-related endonuclease
MNAQQINLADSRRRRSFIGGSDARLMMGDAQAALTRLWREKRGEVEPGKSSGCVPGCQSVPLPSWVLAPFHPA